MTRQQAWELLRRYNAEPFHLRHALTVEGVMRCFAEQRGYDSEFWGIVGLLHDIDFEQWPEQHCVKAPELLREGGADESIIHAVCSTAGQFAWISSRSTRWKSCCMQPMS